MTDRKQRLAALADRVEALTGPDIHVDAEIRDTIRLPSDYAADWRGWGFDEAGKPIERAKAYPYTASLEAAVTLVPSDWNWEAGDNTRRGPVGIVENGQNFFIGVGSRRNSARRWYEVRAETPALALLAAALRAQSETVA